MSTADFTTTKSTKSRVLAAIKHFGAITIKDIANYCSLSIPIVSHHVEVMLNEGLLKEQVTSVATTGRKPKLFSLSADYGYIIGVEFGLLHMAKTGVFAFDGTLISNTSVSYNLQCDAEEIIDNVIKVIEEQIRTLPLNRNNILYIVIGNPGVVNPDSGSIALSAISAKWSKLPLKIIFQQHFGVSVKVLNDVNLSAIGEKEFGEGHGYSNFVFIRQSIGFKAGIILKNRLYQGETSAAGEIGYSTLSILQNGALVHITAESYLSIPAICDRIASKLANHPNDIFYSITGGNLQNVTVDNIAKALGTPSFVNACISEAGEMFGYVLVNVVANLDIALIIVNGDITKFNNYFFKPARKVLSDWLENPPTVLVSSLGDNVALLGAFCVGQEEFLNSIK